MIEEVLKNVVEAEAEAERIRSEAEKKARDIRAKADERAKEEKERAFSNVRVKRSERVRQASNSAAARLSESSELFKAQSVAFLNERSGKAEEIAEELFGRIKNGDC